MSVFAPTETSFLPFTIFFSCTLCSKKLDSSQVDFHTKICVSPKNDTMFEYIKESKSLINQKLSSRIIHLSILIGNLRKLESSPDPDQSYRVSKFLNKALSIQQKSSFILQSNIFTAKNIKYIENRVLVHKLIINFTIPLKKTPLYWYLPFISPKSLYLKFLDKILDQKPITSNEVFGEFEFKYNEFILFKFECFRAIYSLITHQYIKFFYFDHIGMVYHNKDFTHFIFFEDRKLKFWIIDTEEEDYCVEVDKSYHFIEVTDNYLFAVFQLAESFKVFDIEKRTWFDIKFPKLEPVMYFGSFSYEGYQNIRSTDIFYSDDLNYFMHMSKIWNRSNENFIYLNKNSNGSKFFSQNYLNFCNLYENHIMIMNINDIHDINDINSINDINDITKIRKFSIGIESIPCITADKRYLLGVNIESKGKVFYDAKLDLNTLEITDFNYEDFAQIPNLSNRFRYKYTKEFCVKLLGIYYKKYLDYSFDIHFVSNHKVLAKVYVIHTHENIECKVKKKFKIDIMKKNEICKRIEFHSKFCILGLINRRQYIMICDDYKNDVKFFNIKEKFFEFFTSLKFPDERYFPILYPTKTPTIQATKSLKYFVSNFSELIILVFKIVPYHKPQKLVQAKPIFHKARNSIFYIKNSKIYEYNIQQQAENELISLNISSNDSCSIIELSQSSICILSSNNISVFNFEKVNLNTFPGSFTYDALLSYKYKETHENFSLFILFKNCLHKFESSMLTKSIPFPHPDKQLKTFLYYENFSFLTFILGEYQSNVCLFEIKINLDTFQIENTVDYIIENKQKQVILSELLFDISYFYVQHLNLFTLNSYKIQMKELLMIKERFIVRIDDQFLDIYDSVKRLKFDLKIEGFYASSWSTYNISIIGNHLLIGNDLNMNYNIYNLNSKNENFKSNLSFYSSEYNFYQRWIYLNYLEEYNMFLCRKRSYFDDIYQDYVLYYNDDRLYHLKLSIKKDYPFIFGNCRYIVFSYYDPRISFEVLDCKTQFSTYRIFFNLKDIVWISENDESVYYVELGIVKKYQLEFKDDPGLFVDI